MNLRQIANRAITAVNPNIPAVLKLNVGMETDDTGKRVAKFDEINVKLQTQTKINIRNFLSQAVEFYPTFTN
ncbi:hypothetical protein [Mannheimia indoligenes]|uniref:hypothetical protein n=1 Tax=Mannheimia indoligenes TaxID=3103145 RepID=UPI002FE63321